MQRAVVCRSVNTLHPLDYRRGHAGDRRSEAGNILCDLPMMVHRGMGSRPEPTGPSSFRLPSALA